MQPILQKTGLVTPYFIKNSHLIGELIYWYKSGDDVIEVRTYQQLRWLLINHTLQSVNVHRDPKHLALPHLRYLAQQFSTLRAPKKVLELGLGGGTLHNYLCACYLDTQVDSIEKNPAVIHCYQQFFATTQQQNIRCLDAKIALQQAEKYDWIIIDLFSHLDAPRFLYDTDFYKQIKNKLNDDGKLFINFLLSHHGQLTQLSQCLSQVFGTLPKIEKIPHYANHIVVV